MRKRAPDLSTKDSFSRKSFGQEEIGEIFILLKVYNDSKEKHFLNNSIIQKFQKSKIQ
jgi:hypothetical protein